MIWPVIPFNYSSINYELQVPAPAPPSLENWLGTDDQGRDVLARVIYGFRISVLFAITLTLISSVIGVIAGALQGFYGGWVDLVGQRLLEIWSGLPVLYLLIILASFVQPNFWWLLGIMLLFSWMSLVDVVRAEFLRGRNLEYVRAARALGMQNGAIMFRHILPNAMVSTMTFMPFILTGAIGTLTALDFRFRPAGRLAVAGRAGRPGQGQPAGALARHQRLHGAGDHADPAGVHRGGGARCLRPKEIRCPKFRLARTWSRSATLPSSSSPAIRSSAW